MPFVWEERSGLLLEESYAFSFSSYASGSLEIRATQTNIPTTNPDFTMSVGNISLTTKANTNLTTTITLTAPANLTVTLTVSSNPAGLSCSLSPSRVNVKISANSTLSCIGPGGIYQVTLSGTSGAKSHSQTLTYQVTGTLAPNQTTTIIVALAIIGGLTCLTAIALLWKRKPSGERGPPTPPAASETPAQPPAPPPVPQSAHLRPVVDAS